MTTTTSVDWTLDALCAQVDGDLWYVDLGVQDAGRVGPGRVRRGDETR